jgi:thiamine biosynthesis lipoprotein ApbE
MVGYHNQGRLYYVCGSKAYRRGLGCGEALQVRKEEIEAAAVQEVRLLFDSLVDTKRVMQLVNEELRALNQQNSAEAMEISRDLARVDQEIGNIRQAIKLGLDDLE